MVTRLHSSFSFYLSYCVHTFLLLNTFRYLVLLLKIQLLVRDSLTGLSSFHYWEEKLFFHVKLKWQMLLLFQLLTIYLFYFFLLDRLWSSIITLQCSNGVLVLSRAIGVSLGVLARLVLWVFFLRWLGFCWLEENILKGKCCRGTQYVSVCNGTWKMTYKKCSS